ncbi:MAG: aryl-sulfate sulfotransferase [Urechidicola sp.]|nr:aryl-sulfate sulfotransferase [Urechidicola sp.]
MKQKYVLLVFTILTLNSFSQTIGVLRNDAGSYNGYTLLAPLGSFETYLINNCGQVVHQWTSTFNPAASVYLLENGNLLRTGKIVNDDIQFGGVGGKIELFDWDNNLLWEYTYSTTEVSQHHDIYPLPNGNILMLAVTTMTQDEAIQAGRDPAQLEDGKLFNEQILELEPVGTDQANIVWEWNINDHLIQDFDNTKDNFGVVADNEQLLDINYLNSDKSPANWLHMNSIQYNTTLDQIVMSSRLLSEIYIIDHSTTTAEAALHTGGIYGKGGDFLYRWGNLEAYDHGDTNDRTLFGQHYPHWIADGLTDAGKIMIYNNGGDRVYSTIEIIDPPSSSPGNYTYNTNDGYLPVAAEWQYEDPDDPLNFFSAILSSGQRLPNGNTLICDGDSGYFFEIDSSGTIVWEYINPDSANGILTQGDVPSANLVFRALRFDETYAAFDGRDLTPGDPIEINFDISGCSLSVDEVDISNEFNLYPNPTTGIVQINTNLIIDFIEVYDVFGKLIKTEKNNQYIDIGELATGIYIAKIRSGNNFGVKKIIKK